MSELMPDTISERLEYLRGEIEKEQISWGEIHELQNLAEHIDPSDVQLLEWAGISEIEMGVDGVTDTLTIQGKEWFDSVNGNSYCAVRVFWGGDLVAVAPFQYGYGDYYKQAAQEALGDWFPPDTVTKYDNGMDLPLWQIAQNGGFVVDAHIARNKTRSEVESWGDVESCVECDAPTPDDAGVWVNAEPMTYDYPGSDGDFICNECAGVTE